MGGGSWEEVKAHGIRVVPQNTNIKFRATAYQHQMINARINGFGNNFAGWCHGLADNTINKSKHAKK